MPDCLHTQYYYYYYYCLAFLGKGLVDLACVQEHLIFVFSI